MRRKRRPGRARSATRWPARLNGAPSTQRVVKPSAVELGREHLPDLAHAGKVLRPAIDVDGPFEERQGFGVVGIHVSDDRAFVGRQSCGRLAVRSPRHEQHRNCGRNEPAEGHDLILARPGEPSVLPLVPYT